MSFSSLYIGATGVIAHGDRMQVVSNNLANVDTIGYKKSDALFADLISKQMAGGGAEYQSGAKYASQIGMGVGMGEIRNVFEEGALESSNTVTDLAITGNGFFGIRDANGTGSSSDSSYYTRAGAFRFDNEAYLVNPQGYRLQGYAVDRETGEVAAAASDVQLPYEDIVVDGVATRLIRSEPLATSSVQMVTNLDAMAGDTYSSSSNPFFAMLEAYDASSNENASSPFGNNLPAYSTSLNVYDEDGNEQDMTIYFDPVDSNAISNASSGFTYWEYLIAMPASSDGSSAYGTSAAGLAGLGILTFNASGELVDHSAFALNASSGAGGKSLSSWGQASFSEDGRPEFDYTFGSEGAAIGAAQTIAYDFGLSSSTGTWTSGAGGAASVGTNTAALAGMANLAERDARSTTDYDSGSVTLYQDQNGYSWGYLETTSVDREGFLTGHFTNGQSEEFYQIAMYRFNSEWGLRRAGSTNFLATDASGDPIEGVANENGRGTMQQNYLETSNVDLAEEFATMIITQRGYQANTKVITTSDSLLNTTISIKR
ncbi:flagellar hook protein FlgE [Pseudodesulfovibrio piezophilus]|uniref:Flagellar hook protein FlgE n=1 Tax=Pseudodesulfovibrio piezophilus (strain DSM 21447 / JCM 15486 / C1TLV30) TaxID=1322246 RepID=M1WTJ7_PSEP2|nr:flagellar hook-basal body complex protein [Pseudodesulfovibrio piezophilus]CCH49647.1 conserved protein of unknown function [Pseudodesulfovibrio piezophilus C1TLV30]